MPPDSIQFNYGRLLSKDDIARDVVAVDPTIVYWSRLEPLPYNEDLTASLQAQVADPLWMLARQWQLAEFQGEDAGSPIWSRLDGDIGRLSRYQAGDGSAEPIDYQHLQMPLEAFVEQEGIRRRHPLLAAQAGEHLLRLLAAEGISNARTIVRNAFPLDITDEQLWAPEADPKGGTWQPLFAGRAIDGSELARAIRDVADVDGHIKALPDRLQELGNRGGAEVLNAINTWLSWYERHVSEPQSDLNRAWQPERQEYRFELSARLGEDEVTITADEYADGQLDWYSFTVKSGSVDRWADAQDFKPIVLMPAPVRYSGMSSDRFWEFEDARVNLGYLEAGPTDLGRMLLAEFALVFSNDWFLIPVELPVGSLFRVNSLTVRDTFGVESNVRPARNFDGSRWTMFSLTGAEDLPAELQDLFFLPPTLSHRLEADPLEEVALVRDEMANMAWAVELRVQGASGLPMDRRMELLAADVHQRIDADDVTADLIYRLMTPVADNWLPFVPVADRSSFRFSIDLERRVLLRTLPNGDQQEVHPKGIIVRQDLTIPVDEEPALRICEEEVGNSGTTIVRSFQYARSLDGGRHLWVGRRKRSGGLSGPAGGPVLNYDNTIATGIAQLPAPIRVPDIIGQWRLDEVRQRLQALRLVLAPTPFARGTIVDQSPAAGELVAVGTVVTVNMIDYEFEVNNIEPDQGKASTEITVVLTGINMHMPIPPNSEAGEYVMIHNDEVDSQVTVSHGQLGDRRMAVTIRIADNAVPGIRTLAVRTRRRSGDPLLLLHGPTLTVVPQP